MIDKNLDHPFLHSDCAGAAAIIRAAGKLFAQGGFDQVSMTAIACEAGASKANIFHHFASKEGLYQAVLVSACHKTGELLNALLNEEGSFHERFAHFAHAHLDHLFQERETARLILRELLEARHEPGRELPQQVVRENFSRLVESIRQGQQSDVIRGDIDPAVVATILVGANVFFFPAQDLLRQCTEADFVDAPSRYSQGLSDLLLYGALKQTGKTSD